MSQYQEKKAERDLKRTKATYDLPPGYKEAVHELAQSLDTSDSQVVQLLINFGMHQIRAKMWDPSKLKRKNSNTNRFKYDIEIPGLPDYVLDDEI